MSEDKKPEQFVNNEAAEIPYYGVGFSADMVNIELRIPAYEMKDGNGKPIEPMAVLLSEARALFLFAKDVEIQKMHKKILKEALEEEVKK